MRRGLTGYFQPISTIGEVAQAFIPMPLPPQPALAVDGELGALLDKASTAVGRLDGISMILPDPTLFLYTYIRQEAVLSSQIEGTQSSLTDLLQHELNGAPGVPIDDVTEVSCYVSALQHGLQRLDEGFPLSLRLVREMHGILLSSGRGSQKQPGEFRKSQNWIGGSRPGNARFVPPPADSVIQCMGDLEKFLHNDPERTRPILKAALAHVQFETIHPFQDGNGRLGRLLITLILYAEGVLRQPLLYLSLHFKRHRDEYYRRLQEVRTEGTWEEWAHFFLTGVIETSENATETARKLLALFVKDRAILRDRSSTILRLHQHLEKHPIISASSAAGALDISIPTARNAIKVLQDAGVLREVTGKDYGKMYAYEAYISLLNEDS